MEVFPCIVLKNVVFNFRGFGDFPFISIPDVCLDGIVIQEHVVHDFGSPHLWGVSCLLPGYGEPGCLSRDPVSQDV